MSTGFHLFFICTLISHWGLCQRCLITWENAAKIVDDPSSFCHVTVTSTVGSNTLFFTCENPSVKITNIFLSEPNENYPANDDVFRNKTNFSTITLEKFEENKISQKKNSLCTVNFNFSSSSVAKKTPIIHQPLRNTSDKPKTVKSNHNNLRRKRSNDKKNHFPPTRPSRESFKEQKPSVSTLVETPEPSEPTICTICDCTDEKLIIIILAIVLAAESTGLIAAMAVKLILKYRRRPKPVSVERTNGFDVHQPNSEMYEIPRPSFDECSLPVDSYHRRSQSFNDSIEEEIQVARL